MIVHATHIYNVLQWENSYAKLKETSPEAATDITLQDLIWAISIAYR
jgi:hypothetical protein